MQEFFRTHQKTKWAGLAALGLLAALAVFVTLFNWNLLRAPLARAITRATGRPAFIDGDLKVHVWSWNPSAQVNGLRLENPAWADRRIMFGAKRLTLSVSVGRLLRGQLVLPQLDLNEPTINLERDSQGRASWELGTKTGAPRRTSKPARLPTIQHLTIEDGQLHVVDQIRKLTFSGSLTAGAHAGQGDASALQIRCTGSLNAKPFRLDADGGPLQDLEPDKPYSFTAHLTAADIELSTDVTLRKAFDFGTEDATFVVSGADLADVFYLTGLALPNTPKYRIAATLHVNGAHIAIDDLKGTLGSSDLFGTMQIDSSGARPKLTAKLASKVLDIADLAPTLGQRAPPADGLSAHGPTAHGAGARGDAPGHSVAAGAPTVVRAPDAKSSDASAENGGLLLPDADLQVKRVRGMDADVTYRADAVKAPKVPMTELNLRVVIDNGMLTIDPLSFGLDEGKFSGRVQINARQDDPVTDVDMRIHGVNLSEFKSTAMHEAPLDGVLLGRFKFHGSGTSVHKFAGSSNGAVSVVVPHGEISEAIAELTGINVLQGLGLLITKDQKKTDIRCGILDFQDHDGSLDTTTVYIDTSNVLITGRGDIDLGHESINLALQGDPKHLRLVRLRSPIALGGTLLHPTVGIKVAKLAEQAGVAVALGVLLTPAAAAVAFVDPGLAKDKDCSTVLAQAKAGVNDQANLSNAAGAPGEAAPSNRTNTPESVGGISPPIQAGTSSSERD